MKNPIIKGIVKAAEITFFLGLAASSVIGICSLKASDAKAWEDYKTMINDDQVIESIQDDLDNLNSLYDKGVIDQGSYTHAVNTLKENSAQEIYGDKFTQAQKNQNDLYWALVPTLTLCAGTAGAFVEIAKPESITETISNKISKRKEEREPEPELN